MRLKPFRRGGGRAASVIAVALTLALGQTVAAVGSPPATPHAAAVASPPMGWASWNSFAAAINADVIKAQADAIVASGMKAAGYQYVNIDEGWWQGTRDGAGNITVDQQDWPGGMRAVVDYIHSRGLKAGIYTDAGRDGCGYYYPTGRPAAPGSGSEGHYDQDFLQFSQWGFDFVKVDWCGGDKEGLDARSTYQAISDSIGRATAKTGRPMVLSICNWGRQAPWTWAPGMSTQWRDSDDIVFWGQSPSMDRVLGNFDAAQHPEAQGPGHYNDPDMLVVGMPGFSAAQNRTHLSLWAVSGAPLLAGNNIATMSADTRAVLTNREVIAIDQDSLGRQGVKVAEDRTGRQVYSKELAGGGHRAVVALNRTDSAADIPVRFADLGLADTASVRDVWGAADRGSMTGSYTVTVPAHQAVLLTVTGTDKPGGTSVGSIVGKQSGRCLDIDNSSTTNGTQAQLWDCNGQDNQRWTYTAGRQLTVYGGGKCLDALNAGTAAGTKVVIWDCNGQADQQWTVGGDGTIRAVQSGLCLDATGAQTGNGTKAILWTCGAGDNQRWSFR